MGALDRKLVKGWRFAAREVEALRAQRPEVGIRRALAARVRWNLELGSVPVRLAALEGALARIESDPPAAPRDDETLGLAQRALVDAAEARRELEVMRRVAASSEWVDALAPSKTLVSVVVPTRNRARLLLEAIASVQASSHNVWELIVVDDGSDDETAELLGTIDDPRVRVERHERRRGSAAARNTGLELCRGELIAYLDDDNLMGRRWLRALIWAFDLHPEADVVYGALLHQENGQEPELHFEPFDRRRLELANVADQSAIAHRAEIDARQDESLDHGADWEVMLRIAAGRDPLAVPVVATIYRDVAEHRMSRQPGARHEYASIQERALRSRPLRILGVNSMFPLITETYIHDELHSLEQLGAELAWFRQSRVPSPLKVSQPVYEDLEQAVAEVRPDVLFLHWASFAITQRERLEALGIPFAVRAHSFDQGTTFARELGEHPLCAGVWGYPSPDGAPSVHHELVPLFSTHNTLPDPAPQRDVVMSVSVGLPKKDFALLLDAFDRLPGVDRRLVIGLTIGHERMAEQLAEMIATRSDPPLLQVNLERSQVHGLLSRAAASVYTITPETSFGMPMSIVEALCSGCCVIVPDRPECLAYAGPDARPYRSAADIARHAAEALAGGPEIEAERARNRAYGLQRFCSPELGEVFMEQLLQGIDRVRARQAGFAVGPASLGVPAGL